MFKGIILSLMAILSLASAQTLKESVSVVLDTNPVLLERLANYKETSKDLSIARSEYLPTLDLVASAGMENTNSENIKIITEGNNGKSLNYYENSLTLMLNLFNGFGTMEKVDYQKSRIIAAAYNFIEKADNTAFEMTRRYIEVVKQRELLTTALENVSIDEEIFLKVKELYLVGLTTKSEMRKIESSLFLARSNLVVQENNTIDSVFNFKKTYGEHIDLDTLEVPKFDVYLPKTLNEASRYAIRNNPSIMVSNYNIKASQSLQKQKKKNYYPKIDAIVQQNIDKNTYGFEDERNRFRAGINLTYNLYRGGADSDIVQKSISAVYRDVQTRNELQLQIIEGLELSWSAYTMLDKQLIELERYRKFSGETLELYKEEYDLGRRTLLDLLSAENDFINAKSQIIRAKYDSLFAKFRILDSMGLLVAGIMGNDYDYMQQVGLIDTESISYDEDHDNVPIGDDLCPSTAAGLEVLPNGCAKHSSKFSSIKHFDIFQFSRGSKSTSSTDSLHTLLTEIKNSNEILERVLITSHASKTNDKQSDLEASMAYANSIKQALLAAGVDETKIKTEFDGSNSPISTKEELNDRVNVMMYLK